MDYTEEEKDHFENIVEVESNHQLEVLTFVEPDVVVIYDGDDSISVSKGTEENQAFFEVYGQTKEVTTTAKNRSDAVKTALREVAHSYSGDLESASLSL